MKERKDILLSSEQIEVITTWIQDKAPNFRCPICGHDHFTISDRLIVGVIHGGKVHFGSQYYPELLVYCNNCFNVQQFLAVPILGDEEVSALLGVGVVKDV